MILGTSGFSFSFRSSRAFHCSLKFLITVFQAMFDGVSVAGTRYQEVQNLLSEDTREQSRTSVGCGLECQPTLDRGETQYESTLRSKLICCYMNLVAETAASKP